MIPCWSCVIRGIPDVERISSHWTRGILLVWLKHVMLCTSDKRLKDLIWNFESISVGFYSFGCDVVWGERRTVFR